MSTNNNLISDSSYVNAIEFHGTQITTPQHPLERANERIRNTFVSIGENIKRGWQRVKDFFKGLLGRTRPISIEEDDKVYPELRRVAENAGSWIAGEIGESLQDGVDTVTKKVQEKTGLEPKKDHKIELKTVNGLSLELAHWPALPFKGEDPLPNPVSTYIQESIQRMLKQSSNVYGGPAIYHGTFLSLPENTTIESVIDMVQLANADLTNIQLQPAADHRKQFLRDLVLNIYGQGPQEQWKEVMSEVAEALVGSGNQAYVPQVKAYLIRIATELPKFNPGDKISFPQVIRTPPIYYGAEIPLLKNASVEEIAESVIQLCASKQIPIVWGGQEERQIEYIVEAVKRLYGQGAKRKVVDTSIQQRATHLGAELHKLVETSIVTPATETKVIIEPKAYFKMAMERLLTDRITPPPFPGTKAQLNIPIQFGKNKERYYQFIVRQWMLKMPTANRSAGQTAKTHHYLYRCLEETFGAVTEKDKQELKNSLEEQMSLILKVKRSDQRVHTPKDKGSIQAIDLFFKGISGQLAAYIHEGKDLQPIPFVGESLRIKDQSWTETLMSGPSQWIESASDTITGHNHQTHVIEEFAKHIYTLIEAKKHTEYLTPIQKEEVMNYLKLHLYQVYGEDNRATFGHPDQIKKNRGRVFLKVIWENVRKEDLPKERKEIINETYRFLGHMMEQIALMPEGHIPEIPKRKGNPLPLQVDGVIYPIDPQYADVWNPYFEMHLNRMTDQIMAQLGNHHGKDKTRAFIKLSLAEIHGVKLQNSTMDDLKEVFAKPLVGWGMGYVAKITEPAIKAGVADIRSYASGLIAQVGQTAFGHLQQLDKEARNDGSSILSEAIEQNILPLVSEKFSSLVDHQQLNDITTLITESLPVEEVEARREYIADLIMKVMFPNGPQDVPALQAGNLEAVPEAGQVIELLKQLEILHSPTAREVMNFLFGSDRMEANMEKAIQKICSVADEELKELEEKGIPVSEGVHAAAEVIRKGGNDVYIRAFQVMLYTIIHQTIANKILGDVVFRISDPRVQMQRMVNASKKMLEVVQENPETSIGDESAMPNTKKIKIKGTQYEVIGKQIFDIFAAKRIKSPLIRTFGKRVIGKQIGKCVAGLVQEISLNDILKSSLEGANDLVDEESGKKPVSPSAWWWPKTPKEDVDMGTLAEEFSENVQYVKNELIQQWSMTGTLNKIGVLLGLKLTGKALQTDSQLNEFVRELVINTIAVTNQVATQDLVLTVTERTFEEIVSRQ